MTARSRCIIAAFMLILILGLIFSCSKEISDNQSKTEAIGKSDLQTSTKSDYETVLAESLFVQAQKYLAALIKILSTIW